jgi:hypothetical protein
VIFTAAKFGIPVSTTHAIGSAIMGVGATERLSAVRWGVAGQVVTAWILTWPSCMLLGYALEIAFDNVYPPLVLGLVIAGIAALWIPAQLRRMRAAEHSSLAT